MRIRTRFVINIRAIIAFMLYFPFIVPYRAYAFEYTKYLYMIAQAASIAYASALMMLRIVRHECIVTKYSLMLFLFFAALLLSTIVNKSDMVGFIKYSAPITLFVLLIDSTTANEIRNYMLGFSAAVYVWIIVNFLCVLFYPNGMFEGSTPNETYYILGHNNNLVRIALPGIAFAGVYELMQKRRLGGYTYILVLLTTATVTMTYSNAAMIGCYFLAVYLFIFRRIRWRTFFSPKKMFLLSMLFFIFVVVLRYGSALLTTISAWFGKDMSLSGRTDIWRSGIIAIMRKPLLGYGYGTPIPQIFNWGFDPSNYHNYFLDLAFRGGILHLALQLQMIVMASRHLSYANSALERFLIGILLTYFLLWQVLPFTNSDSWSMPMVLLLCCKGAKLSDAVHQREEAWA